MAGDRAPGTPGAPGAPVRSIAGEVLGERCVAGGAWDPASATACLSCLGAWARTLPGNRVRSRLLATVSRSGLIRLGADLGCGTGIALLVGGWMEPDHGGGGLFGLVFAGLSIALFTGLGIDALLRRVARSLAWSLVTGRGWSPRRRLAAAVIGAAALSLIILRGEPNSVWRAGPGALLRGVPGVIANTLPAAFVLTTGVWACLLTERRVRRSPHRWVRRIADVLTVAVTACCLLVLFKRDLLATLPATGLLFPAGAWCGILTWRVMDRSRRLAVRTAADIVLSLLLGTGLVLFLVWGANLLDLPRAEVGLLRAALERAGSVADLPWWGWAGLYALLAGASLAFARWPLRLAAIGGWFQRLRVVPAVDASRRALTGVHIGLLTVVLVAVAAPAALAPTLGHQLRAKYTVAVQRELEAEGARAAYTRIRQQFTAGHSALPSTQPLADIVTKVHNISGPPPGSGDATSTERDLASRLGQLQAATQALASPPSVRSAEHASVRLAGFDAPVRDEGDLRDRLGRLDGQQHRDDKAARRADQAADLAAQAVAATIQLPRIGENEIVQVVTEYLSGLVEGSPLKDVFAAWAKRLTGAADPPDAGRAVVPDPTRLELAAQVALASQLGRVRLADPFGADSVRARVQGESPTDAAVDLANETRFLSEDTGPCAGCPRPVHPGEEPRDHPVEPEVHEVP